VNTLRTLIIAAALAVASTLATAQRNYQGLWWGGPSEAGWNLTVSHQDDVIFALWATYDEASKPTWFSMTATQASPDTFAGTLYRSGVPASGILFSYDASRLTLAEMGTATIVFTGADEGTFTYRTGGVERAKRIVRFGVDSTHLTCTWYPGAPHVAITNATDIWYSKSQPGSAVAVVHIGNQIYFGDVIHFTWFTYDADGTPTWFFGAGNSVYGDYDSPLFRTTGTSYLAPAFDPSSVRYTEIGSIELETAGSNDLWIDAGGRYLTEYRNSLERYVFRGYGTGCAYQ